MDNNNKGISIYGHICVCVIYSTCIWSYSYYALYNILRKENHYEKQR